MSIHEPHDSPPCTTAMRIGFSGDVVVGLYSNGSAASFYPLPRISIVASKIFAQNSKTPLDFSPHCGIIQKLLEAANQIWGYSSAGRALEWHSRGQRFDPAYLHHLVLKTNGFQDFFFAKTAVFPLKCHFFERAFLPVPFTELS